jgi:hypothetical protein
VSKLCARRNKIHSKVVYSSVPFIISSFVSHHATNGHDFETMRERVEWISRLKNFETEKQETIYFQLKGTLYIITLAGLDDGNR